MNSEGMRKVLSAEGLRSYRSKSIFLLNGFMFSFHSHSYYTSVEGKMPLAYALNLWESDGQKNIKSNLSRETLKSGNLKRCQANGKPGKIFGGKKKSEITTISTDVLHVRVKP